jgi:multiple sugar transport system ATP-binding protein
VQQTLGVPTIYVTHDQVEALLLGDRIAVIDQGRMQQIGSPDEIYQQPANDFVTEFFDLHEIHTTAEKFRRTDSTTNP